MSNNNLTQVNPQVVDSINVARQATLASNVIQLSGAGKAYQSVAQSVAMSVQDATDYMRNVNTIATTAMGVAMAQLLAGENAKNAEIALKEANQMTQEAATTFKTIGDNAGEVLSQFPSGSSQSKG